MQSVKMYLSLLTITVFSILFTAGCSSISVHQDYNPEYDFTKLKTFGFLPIPADAGIDQLNAERLGNAIRNDLSSKGYIADEQQADFGIAVLFTTKTKTDITSYGYGYGYGYGHWGMGMGDVDVHQYEEGTLVIDFIDMKDNTLVWRGIGRGALSSSPSVEERTERINNAVAQILAQFPPNVSGK